MHRDNLPWILEHGVHCRSGVLVDPAYIDIGNPDLIGRRDGRRVPVAPGGTLSDYVPFYFTPRSPMLLNIRTGYGGIRRRESDEIIILVSSLHRFRDMSLRFLFTDRHAYLKIAEFHADLARLDVIDWDILRHSDFKRDNDDLGKFERYQAESADIRAGARRGAAGYRLLRRGCRRRIAGADRQGGWRNQSGCQTGMVLLMITYTEGNLLEAEAEALVNTVNTVGVMGKGIALMFREAFPANTKAYEVACKAREVEVGRMFVTERHELMGPKWIINFPTKKHWRHPSKLTWIEQGLVDLKRVIVERKMRSIALPPLGSGNGGLAWPAVRAEITRALGDMPEVEVIVYEPTATYENVAKRSGVEKLTPVRAVVADLVRRYVVLGSDCTLLEIQKLAYFVERSVLRLGMTNELGLRFGANRF